MESRSWAEGVFDGRLPPQVDVDIESSPPQVVVSHTMKWRRRSLGLEACSSASECFAPAPDLTNVASIAITESVAHAPVLTRVATVPVILHMTPVSVVEYATPHRHGPVCRACSCDTLCSHQQQ